MPKKIGLVIFGLTEIAIGIVTLCAIIASLRTYSSPKPLNVLIFVAASGLISALLGIGLLLRIYYAPQLLIFFSGWIILSKILIFARIIILNGALETSISPTLKNIVSILYHAVVISYFCRPGIRREFKG